MNKKLSVFFAFSLAFTLLFSAACSEKSSSPATMMDYYRQMYPSAGFCSMSDRAHFDFEGLKEEAAVIAVVRSEDELSRELTKGISESTGEGHHDIYYDIHSVRNVHAEVFYKNNMNKKEDFDMVQECGLNNKGELVMNEDSYPFIKGNTYLVFAGGSGYGKLLTLSADNGTFDLTNLRLNRMIDIMTAALAEYDLYSKESAEKFSDDIKNLKSTELQELNGTTLPGETTEITLTTPYTKSGMELKLYKTTTPKGAVWYRTSLDAEYGLLVK